MGTLGVAVVGSVFSSVYAASLADSDFRGLPGAALARAQDSVGAAQAAAPSSPGPTSAVQDAFLAGLQTSCVVVGALCLGGALGTLVALPGRIRSPLEVEDETRSGGQELDAACVA